MVTIDGVCLGGSHGGYGGIVNLTMSSNPYDFVYTLSSMVVTVVASVVPVMAICCGWLTIG